MKQRCFKKAVFCGRTEDYKCNHRPSFRSPPPQFSPQVGEDNGMRLTLSPSRAFFRCSYPGKAHFFFIQVNLLTMCIRLDTLLCMHKRLDIAEYLDNEEIVAEYLNMVSESDDPALFLRAIGHIARSKGMSQIAEKTGLGRESLYKALDEKAHPRFETIFKVLNAMGIQMTLVPKVKFRKRDKQTELCVAEKKGQYRV